MVDGVAEWLLFSCEVPNPPSVNNLFVNNRKGGRYPSSQYKNWKRSAYGALALTGRGPKLIADPVEIVFKVGSKSRADLDNHAKALIDLLVQTGHLLNDDRRIVRRIVLEWTEGSLTYVEVYRHARH
jgi:Holliday junction resolvase RusA-like endonuclease